jgi:hypothetical protein
MADAKEYDSYELSTNGAEKAVGHSTAFESPEAGTVLSTNEWADLSEAAKVGFTVNDQRDMQRMGKKQEFRVRAYLSICHPRGLRLIK